MTPPAWPEALRFLWQAARGYRLRPWRSPYLRWRIETYSGMEADSIGPGRFLRFAWSERRRLAAYLAWAVAMREEAQGRGARPRRPPAAP